MRSLLKKAPFELKPFDFNEVVRETAAFMSALVTEHVVLAQDLKKSIPSDPHLGTH